jgi:prophage regulatory protein
MSLLPPRKRKTTSAQATTQPPPQDERIQKLDEVIQRVGIKRAMIYRLISEGRFPQQRKLGKASGWLASEISAWIVESWKPAKEVVK